MVLATVVWQGSHAGTPCAAARCVQAGLAGLSFEEGEFSVCGYIVKVGVRDLESIFSFTCVPAGLQRIQSMHASCSRELAVLPHGSARTRAVRRVTQPCRWRLPRWNTPACWLAWLLQGLDAVGKLESGDRIVAAKVVSGLDKLM